MVFYHNSVLVIFPAQVPCQRKTSLSESSIIISKINLENWIYH